MDAQDFWNVIGRYNQDTVIAQIILLVLILVVREFKGRNDTQTIV